VSLLEQGFRTFFTSWEPYSMAVVAVVGAIVQQSAFQAGPLPVSLPVMDAVEPTVATLLGVIGFGETVSTEPVALLFQFVGIFALLAGIVTLDRSPVIHSLMSREADVPDIELSAGVGVAGGA